MLYLPLHSHLELYISYKLAAVLFQSLKMAFTSGGIVAHISSASATIESTPQQLQFIRMITSNYVCILTFIKFCYNNVTVNHVLLILINL